MFIKSNGYWYISHYCNDRRLRYPTGVKASDQSESSKDKLDRIAKVVTQYITNCRDILERPILENEFRTYLDMKLKPDLKKKKNNKLLLEGYKEVIEHIRSGKLTKKDGSKYSESSVNNNYEPVYHVLVEYEKKLSRKLTYDFTINDFHNLKGWLIDQNYSKNYIANIVSNLQFVMKSTMKMGYHDNNVYEHDEFSATREESDSIALTLKEIEKIHSLSVPASLQPAKDIFVFGCFVALRVGDLMRINQYHLRGNVFEILTRKKGKKVVIPMHWIAREIYDKYNGKLPVFVANSTFWRHLKPICELAELDEQRLIVITKGGVKTEQYYRKFDLVTPHTMRRSFATFMYRELKFSPREIMQITGHSTEESFFRYIKIDKELNAEQISQHPAFTGQWRPS